MRVYLVIAIICTRYGVVVVVWIIRGPLHRGPFSFRPKCNNYVHVMANIFI
jgi:hypothetical protein